MLATSRIGVEQGEDMELKRHRLRQKVEPLRFPPFDKVRLEQKSIHRQLSKSDIASFKGVLDIVRPSCCTMRTRSRAHQVYAGSGKPPHGNPRTAAVMPQVTLRNLPVLRSYK
jgi:hypothetical protein